MFILISSVDAAMAAGQMISQGNQLAIQGAANNDPAMVALGAELKDRGENLSKAASSARKSVKTVIQDQLS